MPTFIFFALSVISDYCIHLLVVMRHGHVTGIPLVKERCLSPEDVRCKWGLRTDRCYHKLTDERRMAVRWL